MTVAYLGDSHARRVACAPAPQGNGARAVYLAPGSAEEDARTLLAPLLRRCFGLPAHPAPDGVVVSLGGNSLGCRTAPHAVVHNAADVAEKIVECTKRVLGGVGVFCAPQATLIILTCIPRHQLSPDALAAFRGLSDALRGVAAELAPRCVLLDVERLLKAEGTASGSWRGRHFLGSGTAEPVVEEVDMDTVSVWSSDALPPDFRRLSAQDFDLDGVHLHPLHYGTIRAAVEEVVTAATLLPTPPLPPMSVRFGLPRRGAASRGGGEGGRGGQAGLAAVDARHRITHIRM